MAIDNSDPDFVNALARGLSIITVFGHDAEALSLTEVAEKAQLTRGPLAGFYLR